MKPHLSPKGKAALSPVPSSAKTLVSQTIPPSQAAAIRGGDGDDNRESYPWVDQP
jgi:hypothetical protein